MDRTSTSTALFDDCPLRDKRYTARKNLRQQLHTPCVIEGHNKEEEDGKKDDEDDEDEPEEKRITRIKNRDE